tara:strand:+ start:1178 stop:1549 length:372 start_codon:yes stop_codon:yes gene_type:complete
MTAKQKAAAKKAADKAKAKALANSTAEIHDDEIIIEEPAVEAEPVATITFSDSVKWSAKAKAFFFYFTYDEAAEIFDGIKVDDRKRAFFLNKVGFNDSLKALLGTTQTYTLAEILSAIDKSGF